jgi:hypothetical protein
METLKDFLWPIVAIGGLGAFIDFLIGKTGQERAKDFLLKWWVRFDDVHWKNFGREEGLFSGRLIEKLCGRRVWSLRRITIATLILPVLTLFAVLKLLAFGGSHIEWCNDCGLRDLAFGLVVFLIGFSLSVSFTKMIAIGMAHLCGIGSLRNFCVFTISLIFNYLFLVWWFPITFLIKAALTLWVGMVGMPSITDFTKVSIVYRTLLDAVLIYYVNNPIYPTFFMMLFLIPKQSVDFIVFYETSCVPSVFRFLLSVVFVGSFLIRPLVMHPVNLVWARIIESEKPVFTVTFGGAAALASAITEAAKHL